MHAQYRQYNVPLTTDMHTPNQQERECQEHVVYVCVYVRV